MYFIFTMYDVDDLKAKQSGNPLPLTFSDWCNIKQVNL